MSLDFTKVTYVDGETVIGADNLNDIQDAVLDLDDNKVEKEQGKGLSTNDYTNTDKQKVDNAYVAPESGIPKGALSQSVQESLEKADEVPDLKSALNNIQKMYPWDKSAKLGEVIVSPAFANKLKTGILDVQLFGTTFNNAYYVSYMNRSNDGNNIAQINISDINGNEVCRFVEWGHLFPASTEKLWLSERNSSGITGFVVIDWSAITAGTAFNAANPSIGFENFGLSEFITHSNPFVEILLPSNIYWVEGRELSIYFNSIIEADDLSNYQIDCVGTVGKQQNERYVIENPTTGKVNLTINVYTDCYSRIIASASTTIHILAKSGNNHSKTVCFIGDSWTENPTYISHVMDCFADSDDSDSIAVIGTFHPWGESASAPRTEGRAGWSARDYVSKSSINGVSNAFWDGSKFDFAHYLTTTGFATPDIVTVFLGINDVANNVDPLQTMNAFDTIVSSIKSAVSGVKVGIALTPPPCQSQDGFGANNGIGLCYWQQKRGAYALAKRLYDKYEADSDVFIVPAMSSVDMLYNVAREEVAPNAYNTTLTITRLTDNVHCNTAGFKQVGDAFYGALKNQF